MQNSPASEDTAQALAYSPKRGDEHLTQWLGVAPDAPQTNVTGVHLAEEAEKTVVSFVENDLNGRIVRLAVFRWHPTLPLVRCCGLFPLGRPLVWLPAGFSVHALLG